MQQTNRATPLQLCRSTPTVDPAIWVLRRPRPFEECRQLRYASPKKRACHGQTAGCAPPGRRLYGLDGRDLRGRARTGTRRSLPSDLICELVKCLFGISQLQARHHVAETLETPRYFDVTGFTSPPPATKAVYLIWLGAYAHPFASSACPMRVAGERQGGRSPRPYGAEPSTYVHPFQH